MQINVGLLNLLFDFLYTNKQLLHEKVYLLSNMWHPWGWAFIIWELREVFSSNYGFNIIITLFSYIKTNYVHVKMWWPKTKKHTHIASLVSKHGKLVPTIEVLIGFQIYVTAVNFKILIFSNYLLIVYLLLYNICGVNKKGRGWVTDAHCWEQKLIILNGHVLSFDCFLWSFTFDTFVNFYLFIYYLSNLKPVLWFVASFSWGERWKMINWMKIRQIHLMD